MRVRVLYLFCSRSCSLVKSAFMAVFVYVLLFTRVCAQDADKIH